MDYISEIAYLLTEEPDVILEDTSLDYVLGQIKAQITHGAKDRKPSKKEKKFAEIFSRGGTMYHVLYAIHHEKCINDLGSTYLKGLIGRAAKDLFPSIIGKIRDMLGLEKLDPANKSQLKTGYQIGRKQQRVASGKAKAS